MVLPLFLILLTVAWVYMLFFTSSKPATVESITSEIVQTSSESKILVTTTVQNSAKFNINKPSFNDLEQPKSITNQSQSSIIALTSPIASTPEVVATEIGTLLDKIESLDNNDDIALDNQILEN